MNVYNDQQVFEHFMRSNIPRQEKGVIRQWFDKVTDGKFSSTLAKFGDGEEKQISIGSVIIAGVEAGAMGAILGALNAELKGGLDAPGFPMDAASGTLGMIGAAATGSEMMKTAGISALAVYGFRTFDTMLKIRKEFTGKGLFGKDEPEMDNPENGPVAQAAKEVFSEETAT